MAKRICLLVTVFTFVLQLTKLHAQDQHRIDSLNTIVKTSRQDTAVAAAWVALSEAYYASNPDTMIPLCNKALTIVNKRLPECSDVEKKSFLHSKADALNNIAVVYQIRGKMEPALDYFSQVLDIQKQIEAWDRVAICLNNIGVIYFKQGQIEKSLDAYSESMKVRERIGDKSGQAQCLSNMGVIYQNQGQDSMALSCFFRSLDIRKSINDQSGMAFSLNNIGATYRALKQPEKARGYYSQCLAIYQTLHAKEGLANTYINLGTTYMPGDPEKAIGYFNLSLPLYDSIHDNRGIANVSNSMALALIAQHQAKEALPFAERALQKAEEGGYVDATRNAHLVLSRVDSALGNSNGAFEHFKQYVFYRDSMANEATRKAGLQKQMKYDYEKREAVLKSEQDAQLKHNALVNWIIVSALGFLLLLSLLLFNRFRLKRENRYQQMINEQQKKQAIAVMETQELERKRIAEDLHDSLGHLLSTVKLNLQTFPEGQKHLTENPLQLLNQASGEIRNITFNLMPRTLEDAGLVAALHEMAANLADSGKINMQVQVFGNFDRLEQQAQFNIYRIVQEAVNNIIKHAQAGEIQLQLLQQDDQLVIMIEDDGKGFDRHAVRNGRGMRNIETRANWLNGTTRIDSTPGRGTTIVVEIPLQAA